MDVTMEPGPSTQADPPSQSQQVQSIKKQYDFKEIQQLFLQFFLEKSCVLESKVDKLISAYKKRCVPETVERINKNVLVTNANKDLRSLGFCIKRIFDDLTENTYYMLINEMDDSLRYQNAWSQHESSYFYRLVDEIIAIFLNSTDSDLSRRDISIFVTPSMPRNAGLTAVSGQKVLKQWIGQHWFEEVNSDDITFGVRTLSEMAPYFTKKYGLMTCNVCSLLCMFGRVCLKCNYAIHDHCYVGHSGPSSSQIKCSICSTALSECKPLKPQTEGS